MKDCDQAFVVCSVSRGGGQILIFLFLFVYGLVQI